MWRRPKETEQGNGKSERKIEQYFSLSELWHDLFCKGHKLWTSFSIFFSARYCFYDLVQSWPLVQWPSTEDISHDRLDQSSLGGSLVSQAGLLRQRNLHRRMTAHFRLCLYNLYFVQDLVLASHLPIKVFNNIFPFTSLPSVLHYDIQKVQNLYCSKNTYSNKGA